MTDSTSQGKKESKTQVTKAKISLKEQTPNNLSGCEEVLLRVQNM